MRKPPTKLRTMITPDERYFFYMVPHALTLGQGPMGKRQKFFTPYAHTFDRNKMLKRDHLWKLTVFLTYTRRVRPPNGGRLHEPPFYC